MDGTKIAEVQLLGLQINLGHQRGFLVDFMVLPGAKDVILQFCNGIVTFRLVSSCDYES